MAPFLSQEPNAPRVLGVNVPMDDHVAEPLPILAPLPGVTFLNVPHFTL